MPNPKDVFDDPGSHWDFLTACNDADFEGQYFDRKQAGMPGPDGCLNASSLSKVIDGITACVSAFANRNRDGGLLALGISKFGEVIGLGHLSERQRNSIAHIDSLLRNHAAQVRAYPCTSSRGEDDEILLIFVPYSERAICETPESSPKAWVRQGAQNVPLTETTRDSLRREKRIVDFEQTYCCPYDANDLDRSVLEEYRRAHLEFAIHEYSDEELLYQAGALEKDSRGWAWKNGGLLFFASNPQRIISSASIRLMRFDATSQNPNDRGLPTFDRVFTGPITKQIRDMRTFLQQSGFFKTYQRRNAGGGFIEEPEYPPIAVDEAIVNAVAHRDYGMNVAIECAAYTDAFVVRNVGRVLQPTEEVPERFSLDEQTLNSIPRNPKLFEWLRSMRDERGAPFVQGLSEGTKRMRYEMLRLDLPAPVYRISEAYTTVFLYNNAIQREAAARSGSAIRPTAAANLFPLEITSNEGEPLDRDDVEGQRRHVLEALSDALSADRWFIDVMRFGRVIAHRRSSDYPVPTDVARLVRFYPAYSFQLYRYASQYYLCIDYTLEVKNVRTVQDLLPDFDASELEGRTVTAQWGREWHTGRIVTVGNDSTCVLFGQFDQEERVPNDRVIPYLPKRMLIQSLGHRGVVFDLQRKIKELSLAADPSASRVRLERTLQIAEMLSQSVFPLQLPGMRIGIRPHPVYLAQGEGPSQSFRLRSIPEPSVEFSHHHESPDIREGITKFGAFSQNPRAIELVPLCTSELREDMAQLIERLKVGTYRYRGAERTFSTRLTYGSLITVPAPESLLEECERLISEHPSWVGGPDLDRIFLVHTPERGYMADDESAPYYLVKRCLLEQGIPCQMVDTPTLQNPDWKDLNLALNIVAKCGVTPWVLPDAIPDADFFIGLSYTSSGRAGSVRLMGYANVFSQYGRWEFYSGNTESFPYEERGQQFGQLVRGTLERLSLSETPHIYFHYSAKFSRDDREAMLAAARSVRPRGTFSFVWINTDHTVRLYDTRAEGDGSLSRGSYVVASPTQIYLSTTGHNPYRKVLGTPHPLQVNVRTEYAEGIRYTPPDLRALAVQVLSLTKLNWASTDSLCAEPITLKYASDIAYLTAAFLRQGKSFRLHPILERTPWFI